MVEHVFPAVSVRQWVVVFPKRMRYFLDRDADCLKRVLGLFERRGLLSSETVGVMQGWGTVAIVLCMRACGRAGRSAG